jgi:hypothetical protein
MKKLIVTDIEQIYGSDMGSRTLDEKCECMGYDIIQPFGYHIIVLDLQIHYDSHPDLRIQYIYSSEIWGSTQERGTAYELRLKPFGSDNPLSTTLTVYSNSHLSKYTDNTFYGSY